uniref:Uncharacterized protein n=1 Tax=Meloidogyne enterolobii TaxID=390850 RepID=A0A6V7W7M9_MELEN|nr:unnamed protein product [Meloidogyne enterolobii]
MSPSIKVYLLFIFAPLVIQSTMCSSSQQCVPKGGDCVNKFCCGDLLCFKWGTGHQCHTCKTKGTPCDPTALQNDFCCNVCDYKNNACT